MKQEKNSNVGEFVDKLTKLSRKYNLYISSCGCCQNPHILDAPYPEGRMVACDLDFRAEMNEYKYKLVNLKD